MRHFKRYCKLIFSTLVVALVFAAISLSASAQIMPMTDPLAGGLAAGGAISGFGFSSFAQTGADSLSRDLSGLPDPVSWDDINDDEYTGYLSVYHNSLDNEKADIVLNSQITQSGYDRLRFMTSQYNLLPGVSAPVETFYGIGRTLFFHPANFSGRGCISPPIGTWRYVPTPVTFSCPDVGSLTMQSYWKTSGALGSVTWSSYNNSQGDTGRLRTVFCSIDPVGRTINYICNIGDSFPPYNFANLSDSYGLKYTGLTLDVYTPTVSRSQDSVIDNPSGGQYRITVPKSYLAAMEHEFSYDSAIHLKGLAAEILTAVTDAVINDDADSGSIVPPAPTPPTPGSETISDTPYTTLDDTFTEFKEFFGDIYSDLHDFKESFGDWVDDVASGWTEVFGDIYSILSGTISDTLSTISSGIQSIVQSIENADFGFVDAFWKNFLTPFNSLFNTIKSHLSIWHYVVEWLSSISSVFTFFRGVMSGAGSGFLLPIYACFAGTVVIAVYKRFGK